MISGTAIDSWRWQSPGASSRQKISTLRVCARRASSFSAAAVILLYPPRRSPCHAYRSPSLDSRSALANPRFTRPLGRDRTSITKSHLRARWSNSAGSRDSYPTLPIIKQLYHAQAGEQSDETIQNYWRIFVIGQGHCAERGSLWRDSYRGRCACQGCLCNVSQVGAAREEARVRNSLRVLDEPERSQGNGEDRGAYHVAYCVAERPAIRKRVDRNARSAGRGASAEPDVEHPTCTGKDQAGA